MLATRILTAALWLPVHLAILIWGRPYHFLIYLEAIALVGLVEAFQLLEAGGRRPHRLAAVTAGVVFLAAVAYRPEFSLWVVAALVLVVLAVPVFRRGIAGALADAGATLFAFAYVPVLLAFLMLLRVLPAGVELLLIFFITIWAVDVAAYFTGRALGKRRLAPNVSPGKTVAGAVGGTVAGLVTPLLLAKFAFPGVGLGWLGALAAGAALAVGDILGDLAESALKRDAGVKDSGVVLPGHGGVLDRFDAVLFCAPLFFGVVALAGGVR
jgi:phosphatidate cytidylyltransferase